MSTAKVVLVTGASSGFGALTVRALADAKHVVYAGMRDIGDRNSQAAAAARRYADERGVTLRPIEMDVSDQASVDGAVATVLAENRRIDVVIHNAGHMVVGPTEAFTPEQIADVYDTNVLSTLRVNRAARPRTSARTSPLRRQKMRWRSATPPSSPGSGSRRRSSCQALSPRAPTISPTPDSRPTNTSRRPTRPSTAD
jgi:NAD(P)-dependent dehydrogenase (short-subunit alcohol dehydrogenase family)